MASLWPCERVLVVDDSHELAETLQEILEAEGLVVQTATSAAKALAVLASGFDPSVIVADVRLGRDRGDSFVQELRSDARYAQLPAIFMSGDLRELDRLAAASETTLCKPFDIDAFCSTLARVCARGH